MYNSDLSAILRDFLGLDGCRQSILATRVGSIVAAAGFEEEGSLLLSGPLTAALSGSSRELTRVLGERPPEYLLMRSFERVLFEAAVPGDMLFAGVFPGTATETDLQHFLRRLDDRLESLIPAAAHSDSMAVEGDLREQVMSELDELFATA